MRSRRTDPYQYAGAGSGPGCGVRSTAARPFRLRGRAGTESGHAGGPRGSTATRVSRGGKEEGRNPRCARTCTPPGQNMTKPAVQSR
jgi:hypothetical protein